MYTIRLVREFSDTYIRLEVKATLAEVVLLAQVLAASGHYDVQLFDEEGRWVDFMSAW